MTKLEIFPSERSPNTYLSALRAYNKALHLETKKLIKSQLPILSDSNGRYCLYTTGSDGRFEKSPVSKVELILLHEGGDEVEEISKEVKDIILKNNLFSPDVSENKDLRDCSASYYENKKEAVFPTRTLDAKLIAGNPQLIRGLKDKLIGELREEEGKRIIRKFDDNRRYARKVTENGFGNIKGISQNHFDLESGILFYQKDGVRGTKHGHLRSVQYRLASDIFKSIRGRKIGYDLIEEFPESTVERFNYLFFNEVSNFTSSEIDGISSAYKMALYWYHLAEENFNKGNSETQVNPQELKEVTTEILKFANRKNNIIKD